LKKTEIISSFGGITQPSRRGTHGALKINEEGKGKKQKKARCVSKAGTENGTKLEKEKKKKIQEKLKKEGQHLKKTRRARPIRGQLGVATRNTKKRRSRENALSNAQARFRVGHLRGYLHNGKRGQTERKGGGCINAFRFRERGDRNNMNDEHRRGGKVGRGTAKGRA